MPALIPDQIPVPANRPAMQKRLFRLIVMLKAMTWITVLAVLGTSLYRMATGAQNGLPVAALYAIGTLVVLQIVALLAWRLVRTKA